MVPVLIAFLIGLFSVLYLIVLVNASPLDNKEGDIVNMRGVKLSAEKFSAALLLYFLGAVCALSWIWFLVGARAIPGGGAPAVGAAYAATNILVGAYMMLAAHAVMRAWKRQITMFFTAAAAGLLTAMGSLFAMRPAGYEVGVRELLAFAQFVGVFFACVLYVASMRFRGRRGRRELRALRKDVHAHAHCVDPG